MTTATLPVLDMHRPDDVEVQFDAERAQALRRRFLWLCAVSGIIVLLSALPSLDRLTTTTGTQRLGAAIATAGDLTSVAMFVIAFIYAFRIPPNTTIFLRLAFWLYVASGVFGCIYSRISIQLDVGGWLDDTLTPAQSWLIIAPFFVGFGHFVTSLLMPWSLRESLLPAAIVLAVASAISAIDAVARGKGIAPGFWISLPLSTLSIFPGALICWWRFSRSREKFERRYFSRAYHALRHELATARKIHESLLPPSIETGPIRFSYVYEPMREIGGDLLFVPPATLVADASRISAVLLDVTGHGVAAALTVNRIVGELERLFAERPDASPGEILSGLNRYACLTLSRHGIYATAICLRLDTTRGLLEYASAGHPPALLLRQTDATAPGPDAAHDAPWLDSTAPLLGVLEPDLFIPDTTTLPFLPGDALLAYTDGAIEARDVNDHQFGLPNLRRLATESAATHPSPAAWPGALLGAVRTHRAGPPEDDTLILSLWRPL